MHQADQTANLTLDERAVYEATIVVHANLGGGADDPGPSGALAAVAPGDEGSSLRGLARTVAVRWERLADLLDRLAPRGWRFGGTDSGGGLLWSTIRKHGSLADLHADVASLPPALRRWVAREGVLLARDGAAGAFEVRFTGDGWRLEPD